MDVAIIEPIGHIEWTLGILFFIDAIIPNWLSFLALDVFLYCVAAIGVDLVDALLLNKPIFHKYHRKLSHTIIPGVAILALFSFFVPWGVIFLAGTCLHLLEDLIGGGPIYFLPFHGSITLLTDEQRNSLNIHLKPYLERIFSETEYLPDDLTWFFFLTIVGSFVLFLGLIIHFI